LFSNRLVTVCTSQISWMRLITFCPIMGMPSLGIPSLGKPKMDW
jgi:hypothetical protein